MTSDDLGTLGRRMARERADLEGAAFYSDRVEPADSVDVDQQRRRRQSHVERCDQTLTAGEQASFLAAEQRHGLLGRTRSLVRKWRRLHVASLGYSILSPIHCDRERGRVNAAGRDGAHSPPGRLLRIKSGTKIVGGADGGRVRGQGSRRNR